MKKSIVVLMAVLMVFQMIAFSGCSANSASSGVSSKSNLTTGMTNGASADINGVNNAASGAKSAASEKAQIAKVAKDTRKVVKSAEMTIQTVNYDKSIADFETLWADGGYIESSSMQGEDIQNRGSGRSATYVVRIPAESLDKFLRSAGKIGSVVSKSVNGEDVTQNYFDAETRLKTLKVEQARILELMGKANKIDDVLAIEQRLTDVEDQIEQLTGEIKKWDSLISLSTVTVTISEVNMITDPAKEGIGNQIITVFHMSINALVQVFRYALLIVTAILPFAAVALVIAVPVIAVLKRRKKNKS